MSAAKYPLLLRVLHWSTGLIILGLLIVGFYMADIPEQAVDKYTLYPMHKAFGMIALLLVLVRLPARWRGPIPQSAPALRAWEAKLSHLVHILLYPAMLAMTISGYFMSSYYPHAHDLDMFGLFTIPDITAKSEQMSGLFHSIHSTAAWSMVVLLSLHIAGVLKHRFLDTVESDVLPRMI